MNNGSLVCVFRVRQGISGLGPEHAVINHKMAGNHITDCFPEAAGKHSADWSDEFADFESNLYGMFIS